jgi:hypothetical protein
MRTHTHGYGASSFSSQPSFYFLEKTQFFFAKTRAGTNGAGGVTRLVHIGHCALRRTWHRPPTGQLLVESESQANTSSVTGPASHYYPSHTCAFPFDSALATVPSPSAHHPLPVPPEPPRRATTANGDGGDGPAARLAPLLRRARHGAGHRAHRRYCIFLDLSVVLSSSRHD